MIENLSKQMNEMNITLKDLSSKPAKNWTTITTTVITSVVTAIVAFAIARLTGK
jgi:hypothetical protein